MLKLNCKFPKRALIFFVIVKNYEERLEIAKIITERDFSVKSHKFFSIFYSNFFLCFNFIEM